MSSKILLHDRFLDRTVLRLIPESVRPNQVTILRILLTPVVFFLLWKKLYVAGIALFLFTGLTDMIDGTMARVRGQITPWGKIWDPVADKLFIGAVVAIMLFREFPPEFAVAVIGIEAAFLAGGYYRHRQGIVVSANWWGKMKMLCQVAGVTFYLVFLQSRIESMQTASYVVFLLAILFAIGSLFTHGL